MAKKVYGIRKTDLESAETFKVDTRLWDSPAGPDVSVQLVYDDAAFRIKFTVAEINPLAEKTEHYQFVHEDGCVEFFVNFAPEETARYINFETNANGIMNPSFRADRYDSQPLTLEEIESLNIKAEVFDTYWTLTYDMPFDFIKHYYKTFDIGKCEYIIGNLQKCAHNVLPRIRLSYFPIGCEKPDFHRPEYFGRFDVIHSN